MEESKNEIGYESKLLDKKKISINNKIKVLERDKLVKSNQLENSTTMLGEIQVHIQETNQEIKNLIMLENESPSDRNNLIKKFAEEKDLQEIDKKLKEKLRDLALKRQPLLPDKHKSASNLKKNDDDVMKIHSVKILYLKGTIDGEISKADRSNALEVSVRLLKETKFSELKKLACEFWNLEENIYSLRAYNYALIEYINDPVEQFIKEQKMRPEFWIIQSNIETFQTLTQVGDYFTEDSSKSQFLKNDNKLKQAIDIGGRKANYTSFLESFEGLKKVLPKESKIDENYEAARLESWELNIFTLAISAILLAMTLMIHYYLGDFENRYWISYQMRQSITNR